MAFNQLDNKPESWKLSDKDLSTQEFYTIQKGKGASNTMHYLPPMQGIIEKAKVKLTKAIKRNPPKKKAQSKVSKRRGKTGQKGIKKKKPVKARKPAKKSKGKKKVARKTKK